MKSRKLFYGVLLLSLLLAACAGGLKTSKTDKPAPAPVVNKYHQKVEVAYCAQCHVQQGGNYQLKAYDPVEACRGCHQPTGKDHPLHLMFDADHMSVKLPLYQNKVACLTCHDPHDRQGYFALLRMDSKYICQNCHFNK